MSGCSGPSAFSLIASARSQERFGFGVVAHCLVKLRQVVEAGSGVGMLRAERFLPNRQGALQERFGFGVVTHRIVKHC